MMMMFVVVAAVEMQLLMQRELFLVQLFLVLVRELMLHIVSYVLDPMFPMKLILYYPFSSSYSMH